MTFAAASKRRRMMQGLMVLGPLLIGAYPVTGLINPLWGSLFGFPLYIAAHGHAVYEPHPWTEFAAFLIWPLVVIAGMAWAADRVLSLNAPWRHAIVTLWLASAFTVVPFYDAFRLFPGWPIYCACE
jgi:hypothetical protein